MKLSTKQKAVLDKGQALMKKAVALQKKSGTKTITVKSGGKAQKLEVFKLNIKDALKRSKSGKKLF